MGSHSCACDILVKPSKGPADAGMLFIIHVTGVCTNGSRLGKRPHPTCGLGTTYRVNEGIVAVKGTAVACENSALL